MGRVTDAILDKQVGVARSTNSAILNPLRGGQMGYAPNYTEWVNNQQYIRKNIICVLLEAPTGFLSLPNPEFWIGTLRAMFELHAIRITGLNQTLTVNSVGTPWGASGMEQLDPTGVKMTASSVTFEWNEKYGRPFTRFLSGWQRHLISDPESGFATINTFSNGNNVPDMLADRYSATAAFIEPDPTHTYVVNSWIGTNLWPQSSGEIIGSRDITADGEQLNISVEFGGIYQTGLGVDKFCQSLLDGINITGASPYSRQSFIQSISADVAATEVGYSSSVENVANGALQL